MSDVLLTCFLTTRLALLTVRHMIRSQLALRMARARKRANVSLAEIATAWGCSPSNVAHALAGRQSVSAEQLEAFARLLGVSVASLYGETREARR